MHSMKTRISRSLGNFCLMKWALLLLILGMSWRTPQGLADNWPQWRGPALNGICAEKDLPIEWSLSGDGQRKNIVWKLDLPGPAGSTPVIWDDRIYLTSATDDDQLILLCVSTSGNEFWRRSLDSGNRKVRGDEGNMASPSPCTDGRHVWALVGTGKLACFDRLGNEKWRVDLGQRYGKLNIAFGLSSTPILRAGKIYLQIIHGDRDPKTNEARVICLDAKTGTQIWVHHRSSDASDECEHSYASPTLYHDSQQELLLTHGADYLVAHHLQDGRELWRCGGINSPGNYHQTLRLISSPVASEGLIVVPTAKNGPVFGIRPAHGSQAVGSRAAGSQAAEVATGNSKTGDPKIEATGYDLMWTFPENTPDVPSPLIKDGLVYLCRENGNLRCLEALSGTEVYRERTERGRHRASPVWADGKIYLTCRNGKITVVREGRQFEILAQNEVGEEITASPAIADGTIYLRTFHSLIAVREGRE
jgi:outer membrane protein assembly factor BamB